MNYRWHGPNSIIVEVTRKMADRDVPPTLSELHEADIYDVDPSELERRPEAPVIAWRHYVARGKGDRTKTDPAIRDLLEANKIRQEMFDLPEADRAPLQKEIDKLESSD